MKRTLMLVAVLLATWGFRMYREDTPNLPRSLEAAGYRMGRIGKLHVNPETAFSYDMKEIPSGNYARKNLGDYARYAEAFFKADDRPFVLHIDYPDAHDPFLAQVDGLPPQPLTGPDVRSLPYFGIDPPELRQLVADYYNCISRLDSLVGDLLAALDRSGKALDWGYPDCFLGREPLRQTGVEPARKKRKERQAR